MYNNLIIIKNWGFFVNICCNSFLIYSIENIFVGSRFFFLVIREFRRWVSYILYG